MTACAAAPSHGPPGDWINRHGGICRSDAAQRGEDAWKRLLGSKPVAGLSLTTLNCSIPAAFAWRNGSIFISRGLVELVDDEALVAAIAHELGHLALSRPAAKASNLASNLDGSIDPSLARGVGLESRADAAGIALLRRAGVPAGSMRRMLTAVKNARRVSPTHDRALHARISKLPLN